MGVPTNAAMTLRYVNVSFKGQFLYNIVSTDSKWTAFTSPLFPKISVFKLMGTVYEETWENDLVRVRHGYYYTDVWLLIKCTMHYVSLVRQRPRSGNTRSSASHLLLELRPSIAINHTKS